MTKRGRPPLLSEEAILEKALSAFATVGYAAMSVRALNAELGLSHETISKRFGPKNQLFRAAVGRGVQLFISDFTQEITRCQPTSDLDLLQATVRASMVAASRNPTLGALLHHQSIDDERRMMLIGDTGLSQLIIDAAALLERLHAAGIIHQTNIRELWFLAEGAVTPLHFQTLAKMFDPIDGPVDGDELIDRMTAAIMRSMIIC